MKIRKKILQKVISIFASVLLLVNSFTPYLLIAPTFSQVSAQMETVTPTSEPIPTEVISPTSMPEPTLVPTETVTLTPTIEVTPTVEVIPTTTVTPELTVTPTPTATPSAIPIVKPAPTTESASLSGAKIPLRKAGNLLKEIKKQAKKNYVEGEVIVKFKKNKLDVKSLFGKAQAFVFEKKFSLEKRDEIKASNIQVFKSKKSTEEMVKELKSDSNVEYAQPNYIYEPTSIVTNDTYKDLLWGLDNTGQTVNNTVGTNDADIDAPEAWNVSEGSGNIIVAVIDSGVAYNHPDLITNMWDGTNCKDENGITLGSCNHGYDFENNDKTPLPDDSSHGTHIAGSIAAVKNNSKGVIGVAPNTKIMAIKSSLSTTEIVKAISFAQYNGARVINASWGGTVNDLALKSAISGFDGLFIAASGNGTFTSNWDGVGKNNDSDSHIYPCDFDSANIVCVAASDQNDNLATFSNYGVTSVDVGAPGTNIYSTIADISSSYLNGNSGETFESTNPGSTPPNWSFGTNWGIYDFGSNHVLYGDLNHPYLNNVNTISIGPTYNLSSASEAAIDFWASCDTQYKTDGWADYMALEISPDGSNYTEVLRWDEAYLDSDTNEANNTNGKTTDFLTLKINSSYFTSNFKFRFRWVTDASGTGSSGDGCLLDDVRVTKYTLGSVEKYDYMDGTSMAAPHVAGLAALIEGYNSSLTYTQVKDIILNTGDTVSGTNGLVGKTVTGKRINAQKALQSSNSAKAITSFTIPGQTGETVINESAHTIGITVPFGTNVSVLIPTIVITGSSITPASGVAQNFTNPVTYTVTAADSSAQAYTVTVTISADPIATAFDVISATLAGPPNNIANNLNDVTTANISNFTGLYFEKSISGTPVGKLTFTGALNLSSNETKTFLQNLGTKLDQGNGRIALDISTAAALAGKGATLEMYNVTSASESNLIVRDDDGNIINASGIVSNFTYNSDTDTVSFDASHFTQFDIDTTKPVIASHTNVGPIERTSESGAVVTYTSPLATDNIDPDTLATCSPVSGSTFPIGINTVTCTKTDTAGNSAIPTTFTVTITANNPPSFDPITDQVVNEDSSSQNIPITNVSPGSESESGQTVTMTATSSDPSIVPNPSITGSGATRTLTYTPATNAHGTVTITVLADDGKTYNNTFSRTFSITVNSINDKPVADAQSVTTEEDHALLITLTGNDVDGDTLTYSKTSDPSHGSISFSGNKVTYTPSANYNGSDSFTFKVNDGVLDSDTAAVNITITAVNDSPALDPIGNKTVDEQTNLTFTAHATDPDNTPTYSLTNAPTGATINSSTGVFSFTPTEAQGPGSYTLTVNATDGTSTDSEEITITVNEVNVAPVANNISTSTNEDTEKIITLTATDSDLPVQTLTYSKVAGPSHGTVSVTGNKATYTPSANYFGSDSFTYKANDSVVNSANVAVSIMVVSINDAPTAVANSYTTNEDTVLTIDYSSLLANDSDIDGDTISISGTSAPVHGTVVNSNTESKVIFTPEANYSGTASFNYTITDGTLTDTATVTITYNPINDAPVANPDSASINEDTILTIAKSTLLANDTDVEGDSVNLTAVSNPVNGSVIIGGTNVKFTPTNNYFGSASFDYTVSDGILTNTTTVTITVNPVNDKPVASDDTASVNEDTDLSIAKSTLLGNDSDIDGDLLSITAVSNPINGSVSIVGNNIVFTPTSNYYGSASFDYTISDGELTDTATVFITVNSINDVPTTVNGSVSTGENMAKIITLSATDPDVPAQTLTYTIVAGPAHGTLSVISGDQITYTPSTDYSGADLFTFKANDGIDFGNTATVTITVIADPNAPVISSVASDNIINNSEKTSIHIIGTSEANSLVTVTVSDGTNTKTGTQQLTGGATNYDIIINGNAALPASFSDGNITVSATATNFVGGVSAISTKTVIKDTVAPTVTKLGNNSVDVTLSSGTTSLIFSEVLSASSKIVVQNALSAGSDKTLTYSWVGAILTITATETTIFANDVVVNVSDVADNTTNSLLLVDSSLTVTQTTPDNSGNVTANSSTPQVVITDPNQAVTVSVDGSTTATIDVSAFTTNGTGTLPQITINSNNANVSIPATTVTGPSSWNGVIAAPTVTTVTLPETSGETSTLGTAIEIGFATDKLSFDNAVRIVLPGQAGKRAGYSRPGTTFTEITALCSADSQAAGDALGVDGECKIDSGLDLVIWTKHFTKFASYTKTINSTSTSSSTSSGGGTVAGASAPVCNDQKPGNAPVLLSAIAGFNSVTLTWAKANDPVSYYLVTFGTKPGEQLYGNPNVGGSNTTSYTINHLSGGRTYYFKVRGGNGCMPGDYSNEVAGSATGGFIAGLPGGFASGVLGAQTKVTPTVGPTGQTSPILAPTVVIGGNPPRLGFFQRIWGFILGLFRR